MSACPTGVRVYYNRRKFASAVKAYGGLRIAALRSRSFAGHLRLGRRGSALGRLRIALLRWRPFSALPEPMLARSGRLPTGGDFAYEVKWDGFLSIVDPGRELPE
jgi:ATP-dependent DNA ligase